MAQNSITLTIFHYLLAFVPGLIIIRQFAAYLRATMRQPIGTRWQYFIDEFYNGFVDQILALVVRSADFVLERLATTRV